MSEAVTNELIYAVLQKIQSELTELRFDVQELKTRATATEEHLGNIILTMSGLSRRMDRLEERMSRVERRLEISEHH